MNENIQAAETNNIKDMQVTEDVGAGQIAATSNQNDVQFIDGEPQTEESMPKQTVEEKGEEPTKQESKPQQPQKTNADYARERRKAEHEKALKKARYDAIIDALDGINPYTHEKMVDNTDVEEYLTMKEIERTGKDPVTDFSSFVKGREKAKLKQQEELSSQEEWIAKDKEDFTSKHPDINLNDLLKDELFCNFALGKVGKFSMDKIFTDYKTFQDRLEYQARDRASQILANSAATPGELANNNTPVPKSYSQMSSAEIESVIERVKRGEIVK